MIIGFTGPMYSGKDTAGKYLVEKYGFSRVGFADPLYEAMAVLHDISIDDVKWLVREGRGQVTVSGFDKAEFESDRVLLGYSLKSMRHAMQRFGTEVARNMWGEDFWVKLGMKKAELFHDVVFTDLRFANEAKAIIDCGGYVIAIERDIKPPHKTDSNHVSELGIPYSLIHDNITNYSSIKDFHQSLDVLIKKIEDAEST